VTTITRATGCTALRRTLGYTTQEVSLALTYN